jgi:hypothetical protein
LPRQKITQDKHEKAFILSVMIPEIGEEKDDF